MGKYQKNFTAGVFVGMVCNANCSFCNAKVPIEGEKDYFTFYSFDRIKKDILLKKANNVECIVYEGGDFSLHPEIFKILKFGKTLGLKQTFQTNGIKLENFEFVKKLKKYGVDEVNFSIHAYEEKLSDKIMGVGGAFKKTLKGILNCNKIGIKTACNFVLIKENINQLEGIIFLILKLDIKLFNIIMYIPINGENKENFHKKFMVNPIIAGKKISNMLNIYDKISKITGNKLDLNFKFHNIGRCILDNKFHKKYFNFDLDRRKKSNKDYNLGAGFYKKEDCKKCIYNYNCSGFTEKYVYFFGDEYINPILT